MKIISFTEGQSGEEWLEWRNNGIGASDISVIMGNNPYKTPLQLWEEKCGYRESTCFNAAIKHGIKNEPIARKWVNENNSLNLSPICIEDEKNPYMRASLDGYDQRKKVLLEIKCPVSEKKIEEAREYQSIPSYWYDQMQWQIMLTHPHRAIFAIWDFKNKNCITLEMFGSPKRQQQMIEKAEEFWRNVRIGKPPNASEADYIKIEDKQLHRLLLEYKKIVEGEKILQVRKKELKSQIIKFGDNRNFECKTFKVTQCRSRVVYDMGKMRIDGIDIDNYVKKSEMFYRIGFS